MRPDSTIALPRSMRLMVPVTRCSLRDQEIVQDLLALGVADLLQDDLLGGLCADAAELDWLERLFDVLVELDVRSDCARACSGCISRSGTSSTSSGTTCQRRNE